MSDKKYDDIVVDIESELRHLCTKIKHKGREILINFSITPPQFEALQYLVNNEGITIGELSNKMFLACSTVTDLVDRMEKNDLVQRVRDDKDRRVVRPQVLEKGHELISEVMHARRNYLAEVLEDLSEEECMSILSGITKIYERSI